MDIAGRVRTARKRAQLSQEGLARLAGTSVGAVRMIEQRERMDPHYSTLKKLAGALDMSVAELVEDPLLLGKDRAPEAAGPSEAGDEERIIDASPAEFHRRLSEARSEEALLDLFRRIDAEYLETELTYRADEDNRTAYRDYAHAIERYMMAVLSLNIRGITPPDPEQLTLQARKLEELRK